MSLARSTIRTVALLLGVAAALAVATPASAQMSREGKTLLSINPLGLPFKYVSAEIEQKMSSIATIGGSFSYLDIDDGSYLSTEAKLRLYPNEEAFKGFSIGIAGGISRVQETVTDYTPGGEIRSSKATTAPSIAVIADYNWLMGKTKRVLVGTGVGAKRIFGSDSDYSDINFAYPTIRFQIGVVF